VCYAFLGEIALAAQARFSIVYVSSLSGSSVCLPHSCTLRKPFDAYRCQVQLKQGKCEVEPLSGQNTQLQIAAKPLVLNCYIVNTTRTGFAFCLIILVSVVQSAIETWRVATDRWAVDFFKTVRVCFFYKVSVPLKYFS